MLLGVQDYQCHQGKDMHVAGKEKYKDKKKELLAFDHCMLKSRKLLQPTKKLDCPLTFTVKKIFAFTKYELEKDTKRRRTDIGATIKKDLDKEKCNFHPENVELEEFGEVSFTFCLYLFLYKKDFCSALISQGNSPNPPHI